MTVEDKVAVIDAKLDLLFRAILAEPLFIRAVNAKHPRREWDVAVRESKLILKEYKEILKIQNENTNNSTSESHSVS